MLIKQKEVKGGRKQKVFNYVTYMYEFLALNVIIMYNNCTLITFFNKERKTIDPH